MVVALTAATTQTGLTLGELVGQCGVEPPAYGIILTHGHKFANPRQCQCQEL